MSVTFVHTADWQLGKSFAAVEDPQKRAVLQNERFAVLSRIAAVARERQARFVVVAGDLFDSTTPTKATVSAACSAIGQMGVPVLAIPGNHDHGGAGCNLGATFLCAGACSTRAKSGNSDHVRAR